jgi:PadR family transcriptional regulator, regulatory protein AphA
VSSDSQKPENKHTSDVRPEYVVLGLLMHRSMHGYDLYRQFQNNLGRVWHISQSQMYSILKRLEVQGLVEGLVEGGEGNPSRRYLTVTTLGLTRFSTWLLSPTDCSSRVLRMEFISRLFFASMEGEGMPAVIVQDQIEAAERELSNHRRIYAELPEDDVFNRLSMDFRVRQLGAILEWLHESVEPLIKNSR